MHSQHYYSTGGPRQRDAATISMEYEDAFKWDRGLFGEIGQMISCFDISGPLDAPEFLSGRKRQQHRVEERAWEAPGPPDHVPA